MRPSMTKTKQTQIVTSEDTKEGGAEPQRNTGEGADSAMAALLNRYDIDHLVNQSAQVDPDSDGPSPS